MVTNDCNWNAHCLPRCVPVLPTQEGCFPALEGRTQYSHVRSQSSARLSTLLSLTHCARTCLRQDSNPIPTARPIASTLHDAATAGGDNHCDNCPPGRSIREVPNTEPALSTYSLSFDLIFILITTENLLVLLIPILKRRKRKLS